MWNDVESWVKCEGWRRQRTLRSGVCFLRLIIKQNPLFDDNSHDCQFSFPTEDTGSNKTKGRVSFFTGLHSYHATTDTPRWKTRSKCHEDLSCHCKVVVGGILLLVAKPIYAGLTCLWRYGLRLSFQLPDSSDPNPNTNCSQCPSGLPSRPCSRWRRTLFSGKTLLPTLTVNLDLNKKPLKSYKLYQAHALVIFFLNFILTISIKYQFNSIPIL